ncbi:unnamed protein product [Didymodactylos carnosus]|uniref:Uncharacterized protein n=1 Tax=Didymodactylos carnosus TaxID=1234261 RepID=A0A815XMI2_9BILA|nr:unnamed protein product [Didymodactylos carnosus]CAF1559666.1 unnamed protein product [Didymodactylos carnosus]CAF4321564.1 unnamed protein product [Didymodactylos carnosus]CAF4421028.1 unnamed protein product [Didymodactylos carnosus]
MSVSSIVRPSISSVAGVSPSTDLSRPSIQLFHPPRLSTTSQQHLNNGCLPSSTLGRLSQAEVLSQTFTVGGHHSSNTNLKCSEILRLKLKYYLLTLTLTILLAFLLIITIELSMQVFHFNPTTTIITNTTINKTIYKTELKIHSYFFCTWIFNFLLLSCFPLQITIYKYCVSKTTTTTIR